MEHLNVLLALLECKMYRVQSDKLLLTIKYLLSSMKMRYYIRTLMQTSSISLKYYDIQDTMLEIYFANVI
jgi:hypothetical protein